MRYWPKVGSTAPGNERKLREFVAGGIKLTMPARGFLRYYFDWYNQDHHHFGIGLMTPNQVHYGQANAVYLARQHTLDQALRQHPERFVNRPPTPPAKPKATWINPPSTKPKRFIDCQCTR